MCPGKLRLIVLLLPAMLIAGDRGPARVPEARTTDAYGDPLPEGAVARLGTVRFRCGSLLAFSSDGKTIALGGGGIRFADSQSGKELQSFNFDVAPLTVLGLALAPDGKTLALACSNPTEWNDRKKIKGAIVFWDAATGKEVKRIDTGGIPGRHMVYSPDGKLLVADHQVWEVATGKKLQDLPVGEQPPPFAFAADAQPAFSADGKLLALASGCLPNRHESVVFLFDVDGWKKIRTMAPDPDGKPTYGRTLPALVFSPDGKWIVAGTNIDGVRIWDASTGKMAAFLEAPCSYQGSLSISPDSKLLAIASLQTSIWDLTARKRLHVLDRADVVAFSPAAVTPTVLATGGGWGSAVRFWDPQTGKEVSKHDAPYSAVELTQWLPGGKLVSFSAGEKGYRLWDARTSKQLARVSTGESFVWWPVASPDGRFLALSSWRGWKGDDEAIHLFDLQTGKEVHQLGSKEGSYPVGFLADGRILVASEQVNRLAFWDTATGKLKRRLDLDLAKEPNQGRGGFGGAKRFAFSADGKSLVIEMELSVPPPPGSEDPGGMICLEYFWCGVDPATGKQRWRTEHVQQTDALAISPDGKLVACGMPGAIQLRNGGTGALLRELDTDAKNGRSYHRQAGAMAFTPDGKKLVAADHLANVFVWDVATGKELHKFVGHRGRVFSVSVSPDGTTLATASEDSTVLLWRLDAKP